MTEWHRVVFSDESRFCLSSDSRRVRVWRRRGERSNPAAICGNPITHPLPRLPSTFHNGITTESVKVDRMTEDKQRMTEVEDEHVADALTNMQPHCDDLVGRLADAIRGLAVPRAEEAIISSFDGSHATSSLPPNSHLQRSTPASISHFKGIRDVHGPTTFVRGLPLPPWSYHLDLPLSLARSEMPPKKRKPIGKVLPKHRLRINRERASTSRAAESVGQRENRLQQERDRASTSRAAESLEQRENRLQQERDRASTSRAAESVGQRENRLRQKRNRASTSRAAESVGQRENRLQQDRDRASTSRAAESLGQRENRLQQERDRASTSRAAESLEQRENRLQQERDRASTSRAAESVGQRENRLRQNRNRASTSRAAESLEQRENRLQQERDRASTSRAAESVGQRENRLRQNRNRGGAIGPLVSHISEFTVGLHGYCSGSGLMTPYFALQGSPLLVLLLPPTT
ncbi:hypothetical protein LAZ67_19000758 [Cordylochernes scorpioides]|uniref:STPR domain-containing protein n=1 Tax=Cordylochernes scorpioides TaxID=51811 RepID=A0ABY6LHL4_9ARAC|nr:hypothetical protein LAZ67_19000758 [Cordylochernes scorpioides]